MPLQDKLDALTAELIESGRMPVAALDVLQRAAHELVVSRKADHKLMAGQVAPSFALKDTDGLIVRSNKLLDRGPLVIAFHLGIWCPYCDLELRALEDVRPEVERRGASIVALSMQTAVNSRASATANAIEFPMLVDFRGNVAARYGLRTAMSPALVKVYKDVLGHNLEQINGERSWSLPMPARYVVGQDGVIAYAEVSSDFRTRSEPENLFPILDCLAHRSGPRAISNHG